MLKFFSSIDRAVASVLNVLVIITSTIVTGVIFFMVIARYILEWSFIGADEVALVSAIWLYMIGAIVASRRAEHLVVDFLPQFITSPMLLRLHQRLIALIMVATTGFFIYLVWNLFGFAIKRPQETAGLGIPEIIPLSAIALASIGGFSYAVRDLITGRACYNSTKEGEQ